MSSTNPAPRAGELSETDRRILDFERGRSADPAARQEAIRAEFGISATRYFQRLNLLLDEPEALAYDPLVVRRLRRDRDRRQRARSARRLAR